MKIQHLKYSDIPYISELLPFGWKGVIPIIDWYTNSNFCFPIKICINKKIVNYNNIKIGKMSDLRASRLLCTLKLLVLGVEAN